MKPSALHAALAKAVKALQLTPSSVIHKLSPLEYALALNALPDLPGLAAVRKQIASQLRKKLGAGWIRQGDICEVFSVIAALWKYDQAYITGEHLASAVQRLVSCEAAVGGPYYSQKAIAITANIQIAIFIHLVAKPLPNVDAFLASVTTQKHFEDTELTSFGLLYWLAKAGQSRRLKQYIASHWHQHNWQTPQHKAIALTILNGAADEPSVGQALQALCKTQQPNGFWEGESIIKAAPHRAGSRFTTTALVVEVLAHYIHSQTHRPVASLQRQRQQVAQAATRMFGGFAEPLRSSAQAMVARMCVADRNFEITLLPHFFGQALATPTQLTSQQFTMLGLANLYTWIAYTIYDDFLDGEGAPAKLPVANIAMRASLDCFRTAFPGQHALYQYIARIFAAMDEANAWEVGHCRFTIHSGQAKITGLPKYGNCAALAARSFAHALPPMAILGQTGLSNQPPVRRVEAAFKHYLIARQLNDDVHDWLKDMQAGQASYVVTAILRDMRVQPNTYQLSLLLPAMQRRFRQTTMPKVCHQILRHIIMSRQAFAKSQLLRDTNDIYTLLDALEKSAHNSLDKYQKTQALSGNARKFSGK